ncbi:MAG TPA: NB-ARC domain-containing protein [Ktedonobacteraceae bacterium]|nr:NB-ARC domain-containing protein [Ktedonobacteraceae bacterium]
MVEPFAVQLKRERLRRGWSQAYLAEQLRCSPKTVNRWEQGMLPKPEYRRIICEFFGKNAEELGLVPESAQQEHAFLPASTVMPVSAAPRPGVNERKDGSTKHPVSTNQAEAQHEDLSEAPHLDLERFYGRDRELAAAQQWLVGERCHCVAILGIGGVGKTTFATALVQRTKRDFVRVFWRSLQHAPSLIAILQQAIHFLSDQREGNLPTDVDGQMRLLMQYLQNQRCLLVLDNVESLFQPGKKTGVYREGYEDYGEFFQRIGEGRHRSCLLLTSRETPKEVARLEGEDDLVRSLRLKGVEVTAGKNILKGKALSGEEEHWRRLVDLYSGNPLALKLVAASIQEICGGDIASFLEVEQSSVGDVNDLLDQQCQRLSQQEREVLFWLAIEREPVSWEVLHKDQVLSLSRGELLETLQSLLRRSLIERRGRFHFTLQPVIMEFVTNQLIRRACTEVASDVLPTWADYAFVQAQTQDYVRESQQRFILAPLVERLLQEVDREGLKRLLLERLAGRRQAISDVSNYFAGNALNLLIALGCDLRGLDFSHLLIRQASLQEAALPAVNFSHSHFVDTTFSDTFGNIVALAYSPGGEWLAAGSATGEIRLYRAQDNTLLMTCSGHRDAVWSLAFSPDGRFLASSSDDETVRLWNTHTGDCLRLFEEHSNRVRTVAFSPDGRLLASGSDDQTIRIRDIADGRSVALLTAHTERIWSVAFSPDGRLLASGSTDCTIRLWDVSTWQCIRILEGCTDWVRSVRFHPGGQLLASGSDDHFVRLWEVQSGNCLRTLRGHSNRVWSVTFSHDGRLLASGSEDQTARLWDMETGRGLHVLQAHKHGIRAVAFNVEDSVLASGGDDQCLRLWDVKNGRCLRTLQGYTNRIWSVAFTGDGQTLVSSGEDQYIRLWNVSAGVCVRTIHEPSHGIRFVAASPTSRLLASCGEDETIRLWDSGSGRCLHILKGHTNWIREVAFSADGNLLASGGEDHLICLWDIKTCQCIRRFVDHTDWIRSLAFSPDGRLLASGSDDQSVRLWDVRGGECLKVLSGHRGRVRSVAFSPDGKTIASGSEDHSIRLWDVKTGACRTGLHGHNSWVLSVAFSLDGQLLASGSDDHFVRLWDMQSGDCLQILRGHNGRVRSIAFRPTGNYLASGGYDGKILLWEAATGKQIATFLGERPYERMDITGVEGLTDAQKVTLSTLGAIEQDA